MKYYSQKALEEYFGNIGINGHLLIDDLNAGKVPSIEIPNSPWHTGTPTEQGWYVCKLAGSDIYETHNFTGNNWNAEIFEKWQIIKEEKDTEGENYK